MATRPMVPNLVAAANEQTAANRGAAVDQAQMNRYAQYGAGGESNVWGVDPATGQSFNRTTMGPQQQAMYDALMANSGSNLGSFQKQYWGDSAGGAYGGGGGGGGININAGGGEIPGNIQTDLDYSKLTAMPTTDPAQARQEAQDALYKRNAGYLDPQYEQREAALRTRLSNQGLVPGTAAYNNAYANAAAEREKAYTGARQDAITGGGLEAERAQKLALELRNQGITEAGNLGVFHNAAQGQGADQYLTQRGQNTALQAAGLSAAASTSNAALANQLGTRQQQFKEVMDMSKQGQEFLPQFTTSQGNVGPYRPGDIQGATQQQFLDAMQRSQAKNPGLLSKMLPVAGSIAGSFFGPIGTAAGGALGGMVSRGLSGGGGGIGYGLSSPEYAGAGLPY